MSETFLQVDGVRLEARFVGRATATAPTLVFLHEGLGSVSHWRDFPDRLCGRVGLAGFVYSRRGYGKSDSVTAAARDVRFMHDEAALLPAVLDAAGLNRVVLVGHSDGASIALLCAAEDAGRRVDAVVAMAPHLFVEELSVRSIAAIKESWNTTDLRTRLAKHHGANVDGAFLGWSGVWLSEEFRSWNIEREVERIIVPTLAIQGEDDAYGTLAQIDSLKNRAHGRVETCVLPRAGHAPWRDQPAAVIEAIAQFLGRP